jgi:hypothetical protein
VLKGGSEAVSFDYFRLYWRLATKEDGEVKVPGTFFKANSALPMAPEPLTNFVLSNLMPGLLRFFFLFSSSVDPFLPSEFITGTPMAPLTAIGTMYIGYLMMHMRQDPISGVDISRMGEILCTIACWIDNPNTFPKVEEFRELVDNMVKENTVPNGASPGKNTPVKALAFALLDEVHPPHVKFNALYVSFHFLFPSLFLADFFFIAVGNFIEISATFACSFAWTREESESCSTPSVDARFLPQVCVRVSTFVRNGGRCSCPPPGFDGTPDKDGWQHG